MAKWREESDKTIENPESDSEPGSRTKAEDPPRTARRRTPGGNGLRTGVRRASDTAASLVRVLAMIICVLLALHIAFVVFSANQDNAIVRTVNDWADWFAWRFRDMFVPKDERVGVLVNYGIAAVVYLVAGRAVAGLLHRLR
ncbi:hypothetical protein [Actinomadura sp. DC4]|uniref:hypothetical protein n=1 Tax=Actinomadura sp. DC4 TaxID=3055069 RepID=UPI0025B1DD3B|nr:hypothetical protein [Actinomadura sp. DC4]MDN3359922.1 hypothetical protein [Actinomadura sp. DC4]